MLDSSNSRIFDASNALNMQRITWFAALVAVLVLTACGSAPDSSEENNAAAGPERLSILCTTGMVADLVSGVVGEAADVSFIIPAGIDPHTYKATQGDVSKISNSDVVVYSGLHLEAKMESILDNFGKRADKTVISLGEGLDASRLIHITDDEVDPHFWFDVPLWASAAPPVAEKLGAVDAANAAYYADNALAMGTQLDALDMWVKQELATIPESQRVMVTIHDAFNYLGRTYGIEVRGLMGVSPSGEAGIQDVSALVDYLSTHNIPSVFVEESLASRSMEAVMAGCQAQGHDLKLGGSLFADSVGPEGTPEATYEGMVRLNVNTLVAALK